jgi:hypothetical protein
MKKYLLSVTTLLILFSTSCRHRYYQSSLFEQQTRNHKIIAILPAQMIFTGKQPKELTPEQIKDIEERESLAFQESLQNGIMRNANSRKYEMYIAIQDIGTTRKLLEDNKISVRDSWNYDDRKLAQLLGVDAVVRMRIQKQRYMSDLASMGVGIGRQILTTIGANNGVPVPFVHNKTADIYASCNLVSNSQTLWNDSYKGARDWDTPSDVVINNITNNFGERFPYKRRRS